MYFVPLKLAFKIHKQPVSAVHVSRIHGLAVWCWWLAEGLV